ncbi:hypothetical protein M089_2490 [Bacteroides ovatus str. 3725 D9 iii]|nr:hypothetical protein M082_6043 [Bacteroides fragilis str. 3725 D9 ii]KDS23902.1 hypothetical protein M088_5241 [Bacteroides ovatus str. 3725 D1 iv]KDS41171.1 hypothetical protein M089_2490 [Bacteroides ovatus str. 3725 D9 iii]
MNAYTHTTKIQHLRAFVNSLTNFYQKNKKKHLSPPGKMLSHKQNKQ